jgi:hypothetical protein
LWWSFEGPGSPGYAFDLLFPPLHAVTAMLHIVLAILFGAWGALACLRVLELLLTSGSLGDSIINLLIGPLMLGLAWQRVQRWKASRVAPSPGAEGTPEP